MSWMGIIVHQEAAGEREIRTAASHPQRRSAPTWANHLGRNRKRSSAGSHQCAANTMVSGRNDAVLRKVESKKTKVSKNPPDGYRWTRSAAAERTLVVGAPPVAIIERTIGENALYSSARIDDASPSCRPKGLPGS